MTFSILISFFALFLRQIPRFTITSHALQLSAFSLVTIAGLTFCFLLAFWFSYSKTISRLWALKFEAVLAADFLTYLPLLFLSLTPLMLSHYISAPDLQVRARLLGAGVVLAVVYLKFIQLRRWSKERTPQKPGLWHRFFSLSPRRKLFILFFASLLVFGAGTLLFISSGITPAGDEPHYLLITHSLLQDRDFDLANNYDHEDYSRYMKYEGKMKPHAVWGARPGSLYSAHSPGVSVLLLPFYALGSLFRGQALLFFIRLGLSVFGALLSLQVYLYARSEWQNESLALWLWFLTAFTSPVFFYSIHVYPEVIVAFLSLAVFRLLRFSPSLSWPKVIVCSLFLASFIWFHSLKYIALFVPLFLYGLWILFKKSRPAWKIALFVIIPAAVTFLYLEFQHSLYGSYSLSSATWARPMTGEESLQFARNLLFGIPWRYRWETLAGYFFDQRDGLLFYAPLYFFALLGAWEIWRRKKKAFLLLLFVSAPYVLVSAFLTQRTGYAPQARPLVSVIWAVAILVGYFLAYNQKKIFAYLFNFAAFLSFLFVVLLLKHPLNLYQETTRGITERGGSLFYLVSNIRFRLPDFLPSYLKVEDWRWLPNFAWLALIGLFVAAYIVIKKRDYSLKSSAQVLVAGAGLSIFFFWIVLFPRRVLLNPMTVPVTSGDRAIFYSVSRSARLIGPGKFQLREDNRTYRFYFVTQKPVEELRISLGSKAGNYEYRLKIFDEVFSSGTTTGEIMTVELQGPPRYKLRKGSYYELILDLGKGLGVQTELQPYLFSIDF
ncbi:MAG: hypothetical protein QHH14_00220 [Clostridiales bacterium]|nr:hypothetical protein [Clostridiales bacterium]